MTAPNAESFAHLVPKGATLAAAVRGPRPAGSPVKMRPGAETEADLWCIATWSPNPQYSPDPSRIHWGINTQCNHATSMSLEGQLFNALPNMPYEPASEPVIRNVVAFEKWVGDVTGCFNGGSSKFRITYRGTTSTLGNLLPYPAYSVAVTHPCL